MGVSYERGTPVTRVFSQGPNTLDTKLLPLQQLQQQQLHTQVRTSVSFL